MMHIEKKFDYVGDPVIHINGLKRYPANVKRGIARSTGAFARRKISIGMVEMET